MTLWCWLLTSCEFFSSVDRVRYKIQIPLPPKIDPSVTMMQVWVVCHCIYQCALVFCAAGAISSHDDVLRLHILVFLYLPSVLWCCWLGNRRASDPKIVRHRQSQKILWETFSGPGLTRMISRKIGQLNGNLEQK